MLQVINITTSIIVTIIITSILVIQVKFCSISSTYSAFRYVPKSAYPVLCATLISMRQA